MKSHIATSVRGEYKEQTRTRILDAAIAGIEEGGESPLTIASVADRAGVTERTVYRHFETRESLLKATWGRVQQRVALQRFPATAEAMVESPLRLFPRFEEAQGLVRASLQSAAGRELRMSSNLERQEATVAAVRDAFPEADEEWIRRRASIAQLICSAYSWDVLHRYWGLGGYEAGKAASDALAILLGKRAAEK
jgi:AcrR family transcriptional regulator